MIIGMAEVAMGVALLIALMLAIVYLAMDDDDDEFC